MPRQRSPMESLARELRRTQTDAERVLWQRLRNRQLLGHKFRRQLPIGPYIVDFVCVERQLIIELDGGQHAEQRARDAQRSAWLQARGFRVLRFWNDQALKETNAVLEFVLRHLSENPSPQPSPLAGEREL
ncbi:Very-short-patch-repair endonuclease [Solimonas aquatica]|uniref:Very-short-patch-repair endonuclease n=1 Tax=Solimonas aquatica TaxID=489703 RepID=A0A1H9LS57_9GAMM|nr:endonuclease domain-containing protein [Solimonas aquatica]SER14301.1 Very-short-patch-repair endonuclease [Solimonas aquatica]